MTNETTGVAMAPPKSLVGQDVLVRQGDGGESSSYFQGKVKRIGVDKKKELLLVWF